MCMYFMIWRLHINITVYHQYPTLAILAHQHLGVDALLELEMTKFWFSFKAQPPQNAAYASESQYMLGEYIPKTNKIVVR